MRTDIPNGMEFELAEIGSASTKATGQIARDLTDTYGRFNRIRHTGMGWSGCLTADNYAYLYPSARLHFREEKSW